MTEVKLKLNKFERLRDEAIINARCYSKGRSVTFISYAAGPNFKLLLHKLLVSASAFGEFDTVEKWTPERLRSEPEYLDHREVFDAHHGAGFWAWKPLIIQKAMKNKRDGDFILYTDCGHQSRIEPPFLPLAPVLSWLTLSEKRLVAARLSNYRNSKWTKKETFTLMNCDEELYWDADQVQASYIMLMINKNTRNLVDEWVTYSLDYNVISNISSSESAANAPDFVDHRYDQSILTNLVLKFGFELPEMKQHEKSFRVCVQEMTDKLVKIDRPGNNVAISKPWKCGPPSNHSFSTGVMNSGSYENVDFFFHTEIDVDPWFELDLEEEFLVHEIWIFNRFGLFSSRAETLRIYIGKCYNDRILVFDASVSNWDYSTPLMLPIEPVSARYLFATLNASEYFHLSGVEIFGTRSGKVLEPK